MIIKLSKREWEKMAAGDKFGIGSRIVDDFCDNVKEDVVASVKKHSAGRISSSISSLTFQLIIGELKQSVEKIIKHRLLDE